MSRYAKADREERKKASKQKTQSLEVANEQLDAKVAEKVEQAKNELL